MSSVQRVVLAMLALAVVLGQNSAECSAKKRLLVVSVTKGFRHDSIATGERIVKELGDTSGSWETVYARTDEELALAMSREGLKRVDGVFFCNTTGDLPIPDIAAFAAWIKEGHGFSGVHSATDTYHKNALYLDLIGAEFKTHGAEMEVEALVEDLSHPATRDLPRSFRVLEEVYQFHAAPREKVRVLIALDKHPNSFEPGDYPLAWVQDYGRGRVFYTAFGHRNDVWQAEWFRKHLRGGIRWSLGLERGRATPEKPTTGLTDRERRDGFRPLFNGKDLNGWTHRDSTRAAWRVENGMLLNRAGGSDIVSSASFKDFTIRYEYMIPKGSNSGVYMRGLYEVQVLDDWDAKKPSLHGNGAIYGVAPPMTFASRPPGEWQTVEATIVGRKVSVILNGVRVHDSVEMPAPTTAAIADMNAEGGPILLQGDHGLVAYRNIRIKPLGRR